MLQSLLGVGIIVLFGGTPYGAAVGQSVSQPSRCGLDGFTPNPLEHIVDDVGAPIHVSRVRGTIRSAGGAWPRDIEVLFEIRGPGEATRVWSARADEQGRFVIRDVPAGTYCFRAMAVGWQSVVGRIVVAQGAPNNQAISLTLRLGV